MLKAELTINCCNIIKCVDTKFKDRIQGNQEYKVHLCNIVDLIRT